MPDILLTGAGFSRNWGGWLADEAFEYLLGCPEVTHDIHVELWKSKNQNLGFENTLQELRNIYEKYREDRFEKNLRTFELMLVGMFNSMNNGFKQVEFNSAFDHHTIGYSQDYIRAFLTQFDAIFTLNQDCLLELKYNIRDLHRLSSGRWRDMYIPGVEEVKISGQPFGPPGVYKPGSKTYALELHRQPYFKLHGSSNWRDGDSTLLIMGGNKGPDIERHFLLRSYRDRFIEMVRQKDTRLLVIGYSFQDQHINDIIAQGVKVGTKLFIIDPNGIDVLDNAPKMPSTPLSLKEQCSSNLVGASRRGLTEIFSIDHVERTKIMRFLNHL